MKKYVDPARIPWDYKARYSLKCESIEGISCVFGYLICTNTQCLREQLSFVKGARFSFVIKLFKGASFIQ